MKQFFAAVIVLSLLLLCAGAETPINKYTDVAFSTASVLSLYTDVGVCNEVWAQVKALIAEIDGAVSVSNSESDVSRFNALVCGESCEVGAMTAEMLLLAREIWRETGGLYDPTVYPLVDLWGFSPRFNSNTYRPQKSYDRAFVNGALPPPAEEAIEALLPLVDFSGVVLEETEDGWTLTKTTPDVVFLGETYSAQMDLGGIAKGYACDRVGQILKAHGLEKGYFTCGGSSMTILENANHDGYYEISIQKPRASSAGGSVCASIERRNTGLSTSSDSNHCRRWEGTLYCHIIDPRTGFPVNVAQGRNTRGIVSVTLTGESAARCDALTTAIMLMGEMQAPVFLREHCEYECLYVVSAPDEGREQLFSTLTEEEVTLADENYQLTVIR